MTLVDEEVFSDFTARVLRANKGEVSELWETISVLLNMKHVYLHGVCRKILCIMLAFGLFS